MHSPYGSSNSLKYATHSECSTSTDLMNLNFPYHLFFVNFSPTSEPYIHNFLTKSVRFPEIIKNTIKKWLIRSRYVCDHCDNIHYGGEIKQLQVRHTRRENTWQTHVLVIIY